MLRLFVKFLVPLLVLSMSYGCLPRASSKSGGSDEVQGYVKFRNVSGDASSLNLAAPADLTVTAAMLSFTCSNYATGAPGSPARVFNYSSSAETFTVDRRAVGCGVVVDQMTVSEYRGTTPRTFTTNIPIFYALDGSSDQSFMIPVFDATAGITENLTLTLASNAWDTLATNGSPDLAFTFNLDANGSDKTGGVTSTAGVTSTVSFTGIPLPGVEIHSFDAGGTDLGIFLKEVGTTDILSGSTTADDVCGTGRTLVLGWKMIGLEALDGEGAFLSTTSVLDIMVSDSHFYSIAPDNQAKATKQTFSGTAQVSFYINAVNGANFLTKIKRTPADNGCAGQTAHVAFFMGCAASASSGLAEGSYRMQVLKIAVGDTGSFIGPESSEFAVCDASLL